MDGDVDSVLRELGRRLEKVHTVEARWVAGSLATNDYLRGVSDLDLVAVTSSPHNGDVLTSVVRLHEELDTGLAGGWASAASTSTLNGSGMSAPSTRPGPRQPRGTSRLLGHSRRARPARYPVLGRPPQELLPPVTRDDVRVAARSELAGYWSDAARHPMMFVRLPAMVDLGLTAMARGRHAVETGELMTKSAAIEQSRAPGWLKDQLRARRRGQSVTSPRWRAAYVAWRGTTACYALVGAPGESSTLRLEARGDGCSAVACESLRIIAPPTATSPTTAASRA